ncbi:hypothetical protein FKM82_011981 [Ascaphus truei]
MMKINHSFAFLLLITQMMPWADGDCSFDKILRRCSCSLLDLTNIMSIVSCIQATSFEFQGGSFVDAEDYVAYNVEMEQVLAMITFPLTNVIFANVVLSEEFVSTFIKWVYRIQIKELIFENTTFVGKSNWQYMSGRSPHISALQFINVSSYPLTDRASDFTNLGNWMSKLKELTLMKSHLTSITCNISLHFKTLSSLDLSENLLQDDSLSTSFCNGVFPNLKTLKLRHNSLVNFEKVCHILNKHNQLKHLDLSQNNFSYASTSLCGWQPSLVLLNLSDTALEQLDSIIPQNCEVLDLSYNRLNALNISLPNLKEIYLSHNKFLTIPPMDNLPLLQVLTVDGNPIKTLQRGQLQYFKHLNSFRADNNPYTCSCSLVHEIKEITESGLTVHQWPEGYMCESPPLLRGKLVSEVNLSFFECHKPLLTVVICLVILLVCVGGVICFVKIHRSTKARSQHLEPGNISSVQFQS